MVYAFKRSHSRVSVLSYSDLSSNILLIHPYTSGRNVPKGPYGKLKSFLSVYTFEDDVEA